MVQPKKSMGFEKFLNIFNFEIIQVFFVASDAAYPRFAVSYRNQNKLMAGTYVIKPKSPKSSNKKGRDAR